MPNDYWGVRELGCQGSGGSVRLGAEQGPSRTQQRPLSAKARDLCGVAKGGWSRHLALYTTPTRLVPHVPCLSLSPLKDPIP